jgi:DNA-binding response OmpR family regulator
LERINILIVDDNPNIIELLKYALTRSDEAKNFAISCAYDGKQAIDEIQATKPDMVILDIKMPNVNGYEVVRWARSANDWTPIILLSAMTREQDQLIGFHCGCDEYLTKPFKPSTIHQAIARQLRKLRNREGEVLSFSLLRMFTQQHRVFCGDDELLLTPREYALLEFFLRWPGQVLKRSHILLHVWGAHFEGDSNIVDVYIRYLRNKLKAYVGGPMIHTVRGIGYVLKNLD